MLRRFHAVCDTAGPTLIIVQGEEGFICGGYTVAPWRPATVPFVADPGVCLFSLTLETGITSLYYHRRAQSCGVDTTADVGPKFVSESGGKLTSALCVSSGFDLCRITVLERGPWTTWKGRPIDHECAVSEVEVYSLSGLK